MSGIEILVTMAPVSAMMGLTSFVYYLNNKRKYKSAKKKIYKYIRDAISALDFDDIIKGFEMLKDFDIRNSDDDGNPKKKCFEKIFCRTRLTKCEKSEILFNIPNEMVEDINKVKRHFSEKMKKEDLNQHLEKVEEEEKKESETLIQLKQKLKQIKTKQLAENNTNRRVIDDINLTEIIQDLHEDYETLFVKTFEEEKDLHNILNRSIKKQMIMKKINMINKNKKTGNLKSC